MQVGAPPGEPVEQFGPLLGQTARAWRLELDRRMAALGLTDARGFALLKLFRAGASLSQKELAGLTGVQEPTLVRVIDWLEAEGLVQREASLSDRRAKRLTLTAEGDRKARRIDAVAREVREELFRGIDQQRLEQCVEVFALIRERLDDMKKEGNL